MIGRRTVYDKKNGHVVRSREIYADDEDFEYEQKRVGRGGMAPSFVEKLNEIPPWRRQMLRDIRPGKDVMIPEELVRLVIGSRGTQIQNIRITTGAGVYILPEDRSPVRIVKIKGDEHQIKQATRMIDAAIGTTRAGRWFLKQHPR